MTFPLKCYTGVGSRSTPPDICGLMTKIARELEKRGWMLRSGGATGADSAFAEGTNTSEIYRPKIQYVAGDDLAIITAIAASKHPAWDACSEYARACHIRNCFQVLGTPESPQASAFVICWTPDGAEAANETSLRTGGTGQAIRVASHYKIPVFNLANPFALLHFLTTVETGVDVMLDTIEERKHKNMGLLTDDPLFGHQLTPSVGIKTIWENAFRHDSTK